MKTPSLIIIHGPSASGKSTVAELVKTQIKPSVHLGSDRLRFHITDFRIDNKKENFDITRDIMMGMVRDYLKKGFSVVVEDQLRDEHVETLLEISRELEVSCNIYETSATREALLERITERRVAQGEL